MWAFFEAVLREITENTNYDNYSYFIMSQSAA